MLRQDSKLAQTAVVQPEPEEQRIAMSYEEWLTWEGPSSQSEWVDGEAIVFMPPTIGHALVSLFLTTLLSLYVRSRNLGLVLPAPTEVRLLPRISREPDILFVARYHADRVTEQRIEGAADLVVEFISDDSVKRDRVAKFAQYRRAGIPEYWIFDPRPGRHRSDFYQLNDRGAYRPVPVDPDGRYRSAVVPGFWLRPEWLWQTPLPDPLLCLREIAPDALAALRDPTTGDGDQPAG